MKISDIVDEIKKDIGSGISTDEARFDDLYIENKIHSARAILISNRMMGGIRFINDSWVQTIDTDFVTRDKDCGTVYFTCPSPISVSSHEDGFVYVGHANGIKPFIRSRKNGFTTLTMHSLFQKSQQVFWDWKQLEQNKAQILIYNNSKLEFIQIRGMFNDPTEVPGFRKDTDDYPVDATLRKEIVEMVSIDLLKKIRVAPDYISDSQDKPSRL